SCLGLGLLRSGDSRVRLGGLGFPPAEGVAPRLTHRVRDTGGYPEDVLDRLLAEAREEVAGFAPGVALDEEERASLDDERAPAETADRAPEEPPELTLRPKPGQREARSPR